jgi:hypothetical protein
MKCAILLGIGSFGSVPTIGEFSASEFKAPGCAPGLPESEPSVPTYLEGA